MKTRTTTRQRSHLLYFGALSLFSLAMVGSGVADLVQPPGLSAGMHHLGYPNYVVSLLGVWKLLGVGAVLAPRLPRLKEWAYAGFTFELSGAAFSHAASGDGVGKTLIPLALLVLGLTSWLLRPASRRLGVDATSGVGFDGSVPSTARLAASRMSNG